jgi:predicted nucleotidyltransferase
MRTKKTTPFPASKKLGSRIADRFAKRGLTDPLPELRGQAARRPAFAPEMIRARLAAERPRIEAAARKRGLRNLRVFGSVARGEAGETSDVDLLVDALPGTSLFDIAGFQDDVEKVLGRRVDVVTLEDLSPAIRVRALADAVPL